MRMEDALKHLADRLIGTETVLMPETTARLNAEADICVPPTVDHTALADSVACASRRELVDSRAFSKLDKFRSERTRWHDWTAVLQSYFRDECGRGKDRSDTQRCCDQPRLNSEEQVAALHAHHPGGRTCLRHHLEQWTG